MKKILYPTLILIVVILTGSVVNAFCQINCNSDIVVQPGYSCFTAPIVCDLNGQCANMQFGSWGNDEIFCAASNWQNPHWYKFVANSTYVTITIFLSDCIPSGMGNGVQWALYEVDKNGYCPNSTNNLVCNGNQNTQEINIEFSFAMPGQIYALVLDGFSGAACHYEIIGSSGIGVENVEPTQDEILTGPEKICVGSEGHYEFSGFNHATSYLWTLPSGSQVLTPFPTLELFTLDTMPTGIFSLCVKGYNACDPDGQELCWELEALPKPEILIKGEVCINEDFEYNGELFAEGSYTLEKNDETGTGCDTTVYLEVINIGGYFNSNGGTAYRCPGGEYPLVEGTEYCGNPEGCPFAYTLDNGCDSTVIYFIEDFKTKGKLVSKSILVNGEPGSTLLQLIDLSFSNSDASYLIKWFDPEGNELTSGVSEITVNKPGKYTATVQTISTNPLWAGGNSIECETSFEIVVNPVAVTPHGSFTGETGTSSGCVLIPIIISVNDDDKHDVFYIQSNNCSFKINKMSVYNRWGHLLFQNVNSLPNDISAGWNGKVGNVPVNPDVYMYILEVQFPDETTEVFKGNITVVH